MKLEISHIGQSKLIIELLAYELLTFVKKLELRIEPTIKTRLARAAWMLAD